MIALKRSVDNFPSLMWTGILLFVKSIALSQEELALQLCWAIGEHGGGGASHKDAARELFESLELLLYESLSSRYG